jgi:peptidoglycan DL-endopeptidase LytF
MNRRDVIIVSVLVNAGLLIILFASAIKTPSQTDVVQENAMSERAPTQASVELAPQFAPQDFPAVTVSPPVPIVATPTVIPLPEIPEPQASVHVEPEEPCAEVKVQRGDALDKLARRHHVSVAKIMELNHLASTNLRIGQTLKIPHRQKGGSFFEDSSSTSAKYYTVKPGDSPWSIAMKYHMNLEELLKLNHLDAERARRLKPGDQLRVQ